MNSGSVYENAVAQELVAHGLEPNYFNSKKQGELDFVLEVAGKVLPLEVKSGKDYVKHAALANVMASSAYDIPEAIVLCNGNIKKEGRITYAPIYMAQFILPVALPEHMIYKI